MDGSGILDEIEDGDPVADGREQVGAVGAEEQVALAVHGPQQVGELEIRLHGRPWSIAQSSSALMLLGSRGVLSRYGLWIRNTGNQAEYRRCSPPKNLGLFGTRVNFLVGLPALPGLARQILSPNLRRCLALAWPSFGGLGGALILAALGDWGKWKGGSRPTQF